MKKFTPLILFLIPWVVRAQNITTTINGSRNNPKFQQASIFYGAPSIADTSQALMYVTSNKNSLLRFDVSELPANAVITSAYLYLYGVTTTAQSWTAPLINSVYDGSFQHFDEMVSVEKVLQPWSLSSITYNNQPSVAGPDDPTTKYLPVPAGTWGNYKADITDFVQGWADAPSTNYGVSVLFNYINSHEATAMNFYSGQAQKELQPRLVITYHGPALTPLCTASMTLRGNLTDGKYKQVNYRGEPGISDSAEAEIEASSLDAGMEGFPDYSDFPSRAIMRYDVSAIPAGSTVTKARLFLYAKIGNPHYPYYATVSDYGAFLDQVIRPWSLSTLDPYSNPAVLAYPKRKTLPYTDSWTQNYEVDVTDFVQSWVNRPDSNYGMQLMCQSEAPINLMTFHSAQAPDSLQPRLEICYVPIHTPADSCTMGFIDSILPYDRKTHLFLPVTANNNAKLPVRICWTFGDGTDSCAYYDSSHPYTGAGMQHRFASEYFVYPVCARVTYEDSCTANYCAQSKVASFCTASFQDSVFLSNGLHHRFTPTVTNNQDKKPVRICWSFGDGNSTCIQYDSAHPYTGEPLLYTYALGDSYQVNMTVQYNDSCSASWSDTAARALCDYSPSVTRINTTDGRYKQAVVNNLTPTVSDTSNTEIIALGSYNGGFIFSYYHTALRYDMSWLPQNAVVMSARLYFSPNTASTKGYSGYPVYSNGVPGVFQHITTPWSPSTISWNNQPLVDTMGQAAVYAASYNQGADITRLVNYWIAKPDSNFGMLFRLVPEITYTNFIFRTPAAADSLRPQLVLCYYLQDTACTASFSDSLLITARATHCFRPTVISNPAKQPARICWAFGDGTDSCAWYSNAQPYDGSPVYHTYPDMHTSYNASMNVLYSDGCNATYQLNTRAASSCSATVSDDQQTPGPDHVFHATYTDNIYQHPLNVCWSFGDGIDTCMVYDTAHPTAPMVMPHSFGVNGLYSVCVTANYEDGCAAKTCYNANYVNCDSSKLVIYGNLTNGKYRQAIVNNIGVPTDTTQKAFIASYNVPDVDFTNTVRTMFRYELSEIPDSAVVFSARLYLHAKDTTLFPLYGPTTWPRYNGSIQQLNGIWWPLPDIWGNYGFNSTPAAPLLHGSTQADLTTIVQQWVTHPESNYGALFHVDPESPMAYGVFTMAYHAGQAPDSLQPRLEICYAVPHKLGSQSARTMTAAAPAPPAAASLQVVLYPNPATNMLNVRIQSSQQQTGAIYLYDIQGRLVQVLQQQGQYSKGINSIHLPVNRTHIRPGIYLVKIQAGAGSYTYKVILK